MSLLRFCGSSNKSRSKVKNVAPTVIILLCLGTLFNSVSGTLPLTKPCDEKECQALEFCRQLDHTCQPCKDVCDSDSHNFDEGRCVSDCQDYIHDERYLKLENSSLLDLQRTELEEKYKDLQKDVFILKLIVGVCVAVIILVVACLSAFFVYFWKLIHPPQPGTPEEKKKPANKTTSVELPTVYNNRYGVTTPTPETSPSSVVSSSPVDTNITIVSSSTIPPYHPHSGESVAKSSPARSESSIATPATATTTLRSSTTAINGNIGNGRANGSIPPVNVNRFRREPSESTLPDGAYDNLSMSPQHHVHYSHHV